MPLGFSSIASAAISASADEEGVVTVSVKLKTETGNTVPDGVRMSASWFDQNIPHLFTKPSWVGEVYTSSGEINVTIEITNSALLSGHTGWLILTDSDGNPETRHKAFCGPVTVQ